LRVDFDKGQIGLVIAGNVMRAIGFPVVSGYVNLQIRSTLYHVLVRYDVTCRIYYETGPQTLQRLTDFARSKPIVTEELGVNFVERSRTVRLTTRSVLIFTTAGKTFATAKTAGSEAGSACAKHGAEAATLGTPRPRKQHDFSDAYAQQVTRRPSDCQLAAMRNHPRLIHYAHLN
jgi:hypothetical protein